MTQNSSEKSHEGKHVDPHREISPLREMERVFDEFFPHHWVRRWGLDRPGWPDFGFHPEARAPRVDVIDRDAEVLVRAEMPGVDKDDIEVSLTDNTVTIKGESKKEQKEEKGDYYRCEISHGLFSRTISLPSNVDSSKSKAHFKDGILELTLTKTETTKRHSLKIES